MRNTPDDQLKRLVRRIEWMEMMGVLSMSRAGGGLGNPTNGRPPNGNPYPHQQQITHPYPHQAQSSPHRPLGAPPHAQSPSSQAMTA